MKFLCQLATMMLVGASLSTQAAQDVPRVRNIQVSGNGDDIEIEVSLSAPVKARMVHAPRTNELVLEIPGALPGEKLRPVTDPEKGINSIRVELRRAKPSSTWVVVSLQAMRSYGIAQEENKITLHLLPRKTNSHRQAPAPAVQVSLLGRLAGHQTDSPLTDSSPAEESEVSPPVAKPPTAFPMESGQRQTGFSGGSFESRTALAKPAEHAMASPDTSSTSTRAAASGASAENPTANPGVFDRQSTGSTSDNAAESTQTPAAQFSQPNPDIQVAFKVKYVTDGIAYLEGGRNAGLAEGVKLLVEDTDPVTGRPIDSADGEQKTVATLQVIAAAETSVATEIHDPTRAVKPGDWAFLSPEDTTALITRQSLSATRKYPVVVSFTDDDDALDDEVRTEIPRPPLPEVNRARGRIGFDYSGVKSSLGSNNSLGLVIRADVTRMYGTYWSLSGYWRGRLNSQSSGPTTLQDLINRTYHLAMTYDNPQSHFVAGFGRLYLPWASSLDTIDGGYVGARVSTNAIVGIFAGSTPDPTSWSYNPNRRIGGGFFNVQGGNFDGLHYTSTSGAGVSMLKWSVDRPFIFFENGISYKRYLSIYHALQADSPRGNPAVPAPGPGISRSFLTLRLLPIERVELDFNHTYFRDIPTFDPQLIGTGLLDKYLFQGLSAGARVEVAPKIWLYTDLGRSNRSGDTKASLNQMYGVTFGGLPWTGIRADFRYSKFDSSFGGGTYKALSLSRTFRQSMRWDVLAGTQSFGSALSKTNSARFVTGNLEMNVGANYFLQGGYTRNWGSLQNYNQWMITFGFRFDNRERKGIK